MSRQCTLCGEVIPAKRLTAVPSATRCVPCLEAAGDVPKLQRFDEAAHGGTVETYFTDNPYAATALRHQQSFLIDDAAYKYAIGEDDVDELPNGVQPFDVSYEPFAQIDEMIDAESEELDILLDAYKGRMPWSHAQDHVFLRKAEAKAA